MQNKNTARLSESQELDADTFFDPPPYQENLRRKVLGWYVWNAITHPAYGDQALPIVLDWLVFHDGKTFDFDLDELQPFVDNEAFSFQPAHSRRRRKHRTAGQGSVPNFQNLRAIEPVKQIQKSLREYASKPNAKEDLLNRNTQMFGAELGLSQSEVDILCLVVRCREIPELDDLLDKLIDQFNSVSIVISCVLGLGKTESHRLIMPSSLLMKSGALRFDTNTDCFTGGHRSALKMLSALRRCLLRPYNSVAEMYGDLLGNPCNTELTWSDFEHLGQDAEFTRKLIRGAVDQGAKGINVLLYGPPGTGKTEFAKTLAAAIGINLISIGEADGTDEASRGDRLGQLSLAQHLLNKSTNTALLLEADPKLVE